MFTRILVAVDSTPARAAALEAVCGLARLAGSTVHVVHIATSAVVGTSVLPVEEEQDARELLVECLKVLGAAGVKADGELLDEFTAEVPAAISAAAQRCGAELIVLSPHHRGVVGTWFNPRVSDAVSHGARVPVLLVPEAAGR